MTSHARELLLQHDHARVPKTMAASGVSSILVLHNVAKKKNFGELIRTASAMGVSEIVVPSVSSIVEYVLKMATGDASCPKGGSPEYRKGEWYLTFNGKVQGERMTEANAQRTIMWRAPP